MLKVKKAVILAAGMGLRLQPITNSLPKCLVEINGKSLLFKTIKALDNPHALSGERERVKNVFFSNCDGYSTNRFIQFLEEIV
tara:strand:+ start:25424 stop:25672 length:249 start_codon:yes stop_codon:yes gene_type:complete